MSQAEKELSDLDLKILRDFHFHAPEINEDVKGELPSITDKAKLFITNNLSTDSSFFYPDCSVPYSLLYNFTEQGYGFNLIIC